MNAAHLAAFLLAVAGPQPCASTAETRPGLHAAVEALAADARIHEALETLYAPGRPVWMRGSQPGPQACALARVLREAASKGLRAEDYQTDLLDGRREWTDQESLAIDVALSAAAMRYVRDIAEGRIEPRQAGADLAFVRERIPLARFVREQLIDAEDVPGALDALEPRLAIYGRALQVLQRYRDLAKSETDIEFDADDPARLGRRLQLLGDLVPEVAPSGADLTEAIKRFQVRHGLLVDGVVGPKTLHALRIPLSERVVQLELLLERLRWLPRGVVAPFIVVNIPSFRLRAYAPDEAHSLTMKVVVGRAFRHQTPVFSGALQSVVFRPYWDVPVEIARNELAPQLARNPDLLVKLGYQVISRGIPIAVGATPEVLEKVRSGEFRVRQIAGPRNALGTVKFVFPNRYDVYLHGTPATELFSRARRDFSHGCIRVEDPAALAAWLLPHWTKAQLEAAMAGSETTRVPLDKPVRVLIFYSTAVVSEDGVVSFFEDIYRQDARLAGALARRRLEVSSIDR